MTSPLPPPGELVAEAITLDRGSFDVAGPARGEPGVPRRFTWRKRRWEVVAVERRWKTTGRDRGGSHERYVRRHWAIVRTADGARLRIYGERGAPRQRWWLHWIEPADDRNA